MAKKIEPRKKPVAATARVTAATLPPLEGKGWLFLTDFRFQAVVIALVGILFYFNTVNNFYALDDDIIMKQNMYVQKGISGIPEIMGNDAYKSYYESMGVQQQLAGGRYRPLSIVTFAIEQSLFGECYGDRATEVRDSVFDLQSKGVKDITMNRLINEKNYYDKKIYDTTMAIAPWRHGFQVFWFVLSMIVLLWLLREHIFRSNTDVAFLSVLLFTIHPIHTEVIANVKSRDEIFSLLFIGLTLIFFFRYDLSRKTKDVVWGMVCFFLAFLSKEYAAMLIFLIPMSLMLFHKRKLNELTYLLFPFGVVLAVYAATRLYAVGGVASAPVDESKQDPLNDPYLHAKNFQTLFSKINRLDDYFWLCLIPYPLAADYSYQHFPYSNITDIGVWISLFVNIGLCVITYRLWKQRHPLAFAGLFYFFFFAMIANIFFDIGATMGERLIYHSSLGICMAVAWLLIKGVEKLEMSRQALLTAIFVVIAIPAFMETYKRNAEWRTDFSLFTHDVKIHPNSALCNGNAGARYMDYGLYWLGHDSIGPKGDTLFKKMHRDTVKVHRYADTAMIYLKEATRIHDKYVNGYLNLGLCYYYKDQFQQAADTWANAYLYFPSNNILMNYQNMFLAKANNAASRKDYETAAKNFHWAAITMNNDAKAWADYAGSSYMGQHFTDAKNGFTESFNALQRQIDALNDNTSANLRKITKLTKDGDFHGDEIAGLKNQNANNQAKITDLQKQQQSLQNGLGAATTNERYMAAWKRDTMNVDSTIFLAKMMMGTPDFFPTSRRLLNHALEIHPNDANALKYLDSLGTLEKKAKIPVAAPKN